ncbi:hypothetical protein P7K49_012849 [Saguinus oedipus]|uniref:Uncharacterized protein n=1 Tax=Saguinus oedipus TaxID=9490 RepID=A0ABQ9VE84_SAGOE|nr:hypothetical protein P7K49_012849 [Saguinus oedipus]
MSVFPKGQLINLLLLVPHSYSPWGGNVLDLSSDESDGLIIDPSTLRRSRMFDATGWAVGKLKTLKTFSTLRNLEPCH